MLGLNWGELQLVAYDADWATQFDEEAARLSVSLQIPVHHIHHVGSTSIVNMPAKPILDIVIGLKHFNEGLGYVNSLVRLGYVYMGENGIPDRHFAYRGTPVTHHLHMMKVGSREWHNMVCFRDYLRQNCKTAGDYAVLKLGLATKHLCDRTAYRLGKVGFIHTVLSQVDFCNCDLPA